MVKAALTALSAACGCTGAATVQALELTANAGFMTDYIYRGVPQEESSVMGGLDARHQGYFLGTWAADVGDGLEVDLYGGYAGALGPVTWGLGATGYFYTDDFDDEYREINVSLGWKIFGISAAFGEYDNFAGTLPTDEQGIPLPGAVPAGEERYTWLAPRVDYRGAYALAGYFGHDFTGDYYEIGYGAAIDPVAIDYRIALVHSDRDLLGGDSDDTTLVLTLSRTFGLHR